MLGRRGQSQAAGVAGEGLVAADGWCPDFRRFCGRYWWHVLLAVRVVVGALFVALHYSRLSWQLGLGRLGTMVEHLNLGLEEAAVLGHVARLGVDRFGLGNCLKR